MRNTVLVAPAFEVEVDLSKLRSLAKKNAHIRAMKKAMRLVGEDYARKIHEGFKKQGINPRNARPNYWPKLVIPKGPTKKGGRTKRGKILKKSGAYLKATNPRSASIVVRSSSDSVLLKVSYRKLPEYAKYHEQQGNAQGYTQQTATAKQAAFLRYLGFRGVHEGSVITLPARRVLVYPPSWKGVHKRLFIREFKKALGL